MGKWEFCKIEPRIDLATENDSEGQKRRGNEKFTERKFTYRMTAQQFTPEGLESIAESEPYQAHRDDTEVHKEMSEQMLSRMGQQGWEPFFTDTRTSSNYFIWHLKRQVVE